MTKFQKRHYEVVAEILKRQRDYASGAKGWAKDYQDGILDCVTDIVDDFEDVFANDNSNFNGERFRDWIYG